MLGLFMGSAILGLIIAIIDDGDFPGWGPMILCVLAALIPASLVPIPILNIAVGALFCGVAISYFTGMSIGRSWMAAGIYFVVQVAISVLIFGALNS